MKPSTGRVTRHAPFVTVFFPKAGLPPEMLYVMDAKRTVPTSAIKSLVLIVWKNKQYKLVVQRMNH